MKQPPIDPILSQRSEKFVKHKKPSQSPEKKREYSQRYRARHHERVLQRENAKRATPEGRAKQKAYYIKCQTKPACRIRNLINRAKVRATRKGVEFSETMFRWFETNPPTHCECCGKEFDYALDIGHNKASPSFDRIDNSRGYTSGNTAAICCRCNRIKGDATLEEIEHIAHYMRTRKRDKCA